MDQELDINSQEYRQRVLAMSAQDAVAYIMRTQHVSELDAWEILESLSGGDVEMVD